MTAWWKVLGQPVLTAEVQKKLIDSVRAEVGSRSIAELEAQRDEVLLGLLPEMNCSSTAPWRAKPDGCLFPRDEILGNTTAIALGRDRSEQGSRQTDH
jgi:hypothetical protein